MVSALDQETAGHVIDFFRHPHADGKYEGIKKLLNSTFSLINSPRATKLLHMDGPGDHIPSILMNEMLVLMERTNEQINLNTMLENSASSDRASMMTEHHYLENK